MREKDITTLQGKHQKSLVFPYVRNGELYSYKYRTLDKQFFFSKGPVEMIFWNVDSLKGKKECIITEGEIDALSFIELGYEEKYGVVSVPNGAVEGERMNLEYLDRCIDDFKDIKKIYLATDDDAPGIALRNELARRFGKDRCVFLSFGEYKDANKVLEKNNGSSKAIIQKMMDTAEGFPVEAVYDVTDFAEKLYDVYEHGREPYDKLGIPALDELISFNPHYGVTALSGPPNTAKSDFLWNACIRLSLFHGWKWAILSPESGDVDEQIEMLFMVLMNKQMRRGETSQEELQLGLDFIRRHFKFIEYSDLKNMRVETFLAKGAELVQRFGINAIIGDPFNNFENAFTGMGSDNMASHLNGLLTDTQVWSKRNACHVFYVVHPKQFDTTKDMGIYDMNGGAVWSNKCCNLIFTRRLYGTGVTNQEMYGPSMGDNIRIMTKKVKKRYAGHVGSRELKYNKDTGQMSDSYSFQNLFEPAAIPQLVEEDLPF
jgi:twinkle protein